MRGAVHISPVTPIRAMQAETSSTILLVEDDPSDLELIQRAFLKAKLDNRIDVARDGQEALDFIFCEGAHTHRVSEQLPRLILLGLKLPKIDGIDVLRRIKGDVRTQAIPVVMVTSSTERKDVVDCYTLGVNSYIVKPVKFDELADAMQKLSSYWLQLNETLR